MSNKIKNMSQASLSDYSKGQEEEKTPEIDHYASAMIFGAIGDALGWPTEFLHPDMKKNPSFDLPLVDFINWKKLVGGKYWGYYDEIKPGDYSDDTQLSLAISRCITDNGSFEPNLFAYSELPLWLQYERGGGRSIKTAARSLIRKNIEWNNNFYKTQDIEYRKAGANGAAMRNLPISLVNVNNEYKLIKDSITNSIITHGHPRAIIGTLIFGISTSYVLKSENENNLIEYLINSLKNSKIIIQKEKSLDKWVKEWDRYYNSPQDKFLSIYQETLEESFSFLKKIPNYLNKSTTDYYSIIGALDSYTKGSGIATTCCAIYLFLKYIDTPEIALLEAVNTLGSDTDTIASFTGALFGARYGYEAIPSRFNSNIQDHDYLLKTARRLHSISSKQFADNYLQLEKVTKKEAYLRILAWEIGLHEMFWDAIGEGGYIVHPTLGRGCIIKKTVKKIPKENYIAKLLSVDFDCGQTCSFHSRVEKNGYVSESIAKEIEKSIS